MGQKLQMTEVQLQMKLSPDGKSVSYSFNWL